MKLMNSETHSWTHSLASLEILAVVGTLDFMILATFAIFRRTGEGGRRGKSGCAHREETILFPILSDLLLRYRRRLWCILGGRLGRGSSTRTVIEGGDVRCVLRHHNSLSEAFELTRTLPHPSGTTTAQSQTHPYFLEASIESFLGGTEVLFCRTSPPSLMGIPGLTLWKFGWGLTRAGENEANRTIILIFVPSRPR